jgi:hypothetical protein
VIAYATNGHWIVTRDRDMWPADGEILPDAVVFIDRLGKVPAIRMPLN